MTIGIYALYWEKQDLIYIGQSVNTEKRYTHHISSMSRGVHFNYKVQGAYNLYGDPSYFLLDMTSIENIDNAEIFWINEFDAINTGLNILEGGSLPKGFKHPASKYSKIKLLKIFILLYKSSLSYKEIAYKLRVNIGVVNSISRGLSHLWLKEKFPVEYNILQDRRKERVHNRDTTSIRHKYPDLKIISKEGIIYSIENISKFCREHQSIFTKYSSDRGQLAAALRNNKSFKGFTFIK